MVEVRITAARASLVRVFIVCFQFGGGPFVSVACATGLLFIHANSLQPLHRKSPKVCYKFLYPRNWLSNPATTWMLQPVCSLAANVVAKPANGLDRGDARPTLFAARKRQDRKESRLFFAILVFF